ncbi:MAG TPA: nitroreductase/quinone reductase family protein [Candidatus Limnocylindrales bacterium]
MSILDAVRRRPVISYVALAWAISWAYWLSMLAQGQIVSPGGSVSHFPGLFGPLIAAFVVTAAVAGRAGVADLLARMFRWRVGARWYALAALPFLLFLAGVGVLALTGGRTPTADDLATYSGLPALGLPSVVILAFLANGFGEEVGWRGFAQPQLERRMSFLRASVVVAAVWAIWHVPSFPVIESYRLMGLGVIPIFAFGLGSGAIVLGWLYDRSGGSILMAALFHLGLNMGSATLAGRGLPAALATTGIMVWAALIVISELRRRPHPGGTSGNLTRTRGRRSRLASVRDASLAVLLRSPFRRLVGSGILLVAYRGRRSGRSYVTPVEFARDADRLLVLVAHPSRKQWWRNVREDSAVRVTVDGRERDAIADVSVGPDASADAARYVAARPRAGGVAVGSPEDLVIVRLQVH